jgi:hypothetical protein
VLSGAVPGAVVNSVRSQVAEGLGVRESVLRDLERRVAAGTLSLEDAMAELRLRVAAESRALHKHAKQDGGGTVTHSHVGDDRMHAHTGLMPMTQLIVPGGRASDSGQRAEWTTSYINNLPDASFAVIEPGGEKDEDGKTTPRSLRHFPYKDADGKLDAPHVRNALSRLPQSTLSDELKAKALKVLQAAAEELGIDTEADRQAEQLERAADALLTRVARRVA